MSLKKFKIMKFLVWKETAGVISKTSTWCCSYDCYFHTRETLFSLFKEVLTEYCHERHMVG